MRVAVSLESRFLRAPDGGVWSRTTFPYAFWTRYLEVFDAVRIVARVRDVDTVPEDHKRCDGEGVSVCGMPYYHGPAQYLRSLSAIRKAAATAVGGADAVILRVPSTIGGHLHSHHLRNGRPYGVEVVGDPYDVCAPGAMRHPLRPMLRWWSPRRLRHQCAGAAAAAYVSSYVLPKRYPCRLPGALKTHYSSIELDHQAVLAVPRRSRSVTDGVRLITVGSLEQLYKGTDTLLGAMALARTAETALSLAVLGDGKHRAELEALAQRLGLEGSVAFHGTVPGGEAVRAELDRADIFVLPSRTEGLPRAMIEAMARGLPCIGSAVGGIPELLPPEDMVPPGDARALARKIQEVASSPERMAAMSARNLAKAQEYRDDVLRERRIAFYRHVRERTEEWLREEERA